MIETSPGDSKDPSRPVLVYDESVDETAVRLLQWAYLNANSPDIPSQNLLRLFTKFAFVYGPSISHPSLRHAACAYLSDGLRFGKPPTGMHGYREFSALAVEALERRLRNPAVIDEGDLFAVSLLAMPVHIIGQVKFTMHMDGFNALAVHLSNNARNKGQKHTLRIFWPLVRDEMIAFGYELSKYSAEAQSMVCHLSRVCPVGRAYDAFEERQNYNSLLRRATIAGYSTSNVETTSTQQMLLLKQCIASATQRGISRALVPRSSDIPLVLTNVRANLHPIDEERILKSFGLEIARMKKGESDSDIDDAAVGLLRLLLCRLLIIVLEAPSIEHALNSRNAIAAASRLTTFIVHVYNVAFRFRGRSMADRPITHTRAAFKLKNGERMIPV
jgi:hypothetical protein